MAEITVTGSDVIAGPVELASIQSGVNAPLLEWELEPVGELSAKQLERATAYAEYVPYMSPTRPKVTGYLDETILVFDCETTGIDPYSYQWLVCSFWDLSTPKNEIVTFASMNEEELTREVADFINSYDEINFVAYGVSFDVRCLLTRFMLYQIPVPALFRAKYYDVQQLFKKGIWGALTSDQQSGSLEDWALYFYDEAKPFDIETCMNAVLEGNLDPYIIRNRWDVAIEGDLFFLAKYVETAEQMSIDMLTATLTQREEEAAKGNVLIKCPACNTNNAYDLLKDSINCYVCGTEINRPKQAEWLVEKVREMQIEFPKSSTTKKVA